MISTGVRPKLQRATVRDATKVGAGIHVRLINPTTSQNALHVLHIIIDSGTEGGHAAASDSHLSRPGLRTHRLARLCGEDCACRAASDDGVVEVVSRADALDGALGDAEDCAKDGEVLRVRAHDDGSVAEADAQLDQRRALGLDGLIDGRGVAAEEEAEAQAQEATRRRRERRFEEARLRGAVDSLEPGWGRGGAARREGRPDWGEGLVGWFIGGWHGRNRRRRLSDRTIMRI